MNPARSFVSPQFLGTQVRHSTGFSDDCLVTAQATEATNGVGVVPQGMSDEEREAAARRAGVAMHAWYQRYQETGDRQALSIAHRHLTQMLDILKGRTPEYVAQLEQERGLA